jgi:glycerophosphoryl diester phosphodiesterase
MLFRIEQSPNQWPRTISEMSLRPLLLGHRGTRAFKGIPENTFASFDLALKHGCDGFEFDVRLTACGTAVICHDPKVGKILIAKAQARELPQLPRFEDVMRRYRQKAFLNIELKVAGLESTVLEILNQNPPARGCVISSFLPSVVLGLKVCNSRFATGIICETPTQLARWRTLPVDYVIPHRSLVKKSLVEQLHSAGRKIFVWTVNSKKEMLRLSNLGVDGIISDDTELLAHTLK